MVNTYAAQSGGCRFESLWGFGFSLKGAYYEVGYCGKKNFLSWTAMHIDFVMCKKTSYYCQMIRYVSILRIQFHFIMKTKIGKGQLKWTRLALVTVEGFQLEAVETEGVLVCVVDGHLPVVAPLGTQVSVSWGHLLRVHCQLRGVIHQDGRRSQSVAFHPVCKNESFSEFFANVFARHH